MPHFAPKPSCCAQSIIGAAPGLDPDLIKPRVARFGQRLHEIERAAVGFFPVVKSHVANVDRRHAIDSDRPGATVPLSSAAMPTATLKVDPGG